MAFRKFEELPAWRAALDLAVRIYDLSERGVFHGHPGLRDQIERAALSVSNNIAEGYERGTHEELLTFLYYARGSAGEVRSMLGFMERAHAWADLRGEVAPLIALCLNVSRQLGAWIESVKNSEHGGTRHQTDATRDARRTAHRRAEFLDELRRVAERGGRTDPEGPGPADA